MEILVIGGTRFIGPQLVARLTEMGHSVTVFHRGVTEADLPAEVRHIHGDRNRLADFASQFKRLAPDVVVDMFALSEQDACDVVETLRGIVHRVVAISSQDVYRAYGTLHGTEPGPIEPVPLSEDAPLRDNLHPYRDRGMGLDDYDKILVERAVMGSPDLPGTILRLPMVYGPGDQQHRLYLELKHMEDTRRYILLEDSMARWRWTREYVANVAHAIALATTSEGAAGRIYNVGEAEALTHHEWVQAIGRAAGWKGEVVVVPKERWPRKASENYHQHLAADTSRIRKELGYEEPVPRDDGLRATIAWERAQPPRKGDLKALYAAEDALLAELRRP